MSNMNMTKVHRFLPIQLRVTDLNGSRVRVDLRNADIAYNSGADTGVESLRVMPRDGARAVVYGFEHIPGSVPDPLTNYEHRALGCALRWIDGTECSARVYGKHSLGDIYAMIVDGIDLPGEDDE